MILYGYGSLFLLLCDFWLLVGGEVGRIYLMICKFCVWLMMLYYVWIIV